MTEQVGLQYSWTALCQIIHSYFVRQSNDQTMEGFRGKGTWNTTVSRHRVIIFHPTRSSDLRAIMTDTSEYRVRWSSLRKAMISIAEQPRRRDCSGKRPLVMLSAVFVGLLQAAMVKIGSRLRIHNTACQGMVHPLVHRVSQKRPNTVRLDERCHVRMLGKPHGPQGAHELCCPSSTTLYSRSWSPPPQPAIATVHPPMVVA